MKLSELTGDYYFWVKLTGLKIMDADGWDRKNPDSFLEKITLAEFLKRAIQCTMYLQIGRMEELHSLIDNEK